ncbi:MAG: PfkB family carbohydrate kinase, partial [Caulobacteraceae bacterium]
MLIDDIQGRRVLVVGDVMLDHFVSGVVERVSPEAPALVVNVTEERSMLGGAANVAANIAALGGHAVLVGVIGHDTGGAQVADLIARQDGTITNALIRVSGAPTTQKTRYLGGDRHLLRADRERIGLDDETRQKVIAAVQAHINSCEAVVISDYAKGVACPEVVQAVIEAAAADNIPVVVDPKQADLSIFAGATLLTPNRKEMRLATGEPCEDDASCDAGGARITALTGAAVLLTRSEKGVRLYRSGHAPWG